MSKRIQLLGVLLFGMFLGYLYHAFPFYLAAHSYFDALTLGKILQSSSDEDVSQAYYEPEKVKASIDDIVWDIPTVPAPFIGTVPRPGRTKNAFINSLHFRDERELNVPKKTGTIRIFLTGGSTAFGSGAPSQDRIIGSYLEKQLKTPKGTIEVFTYATPGWTSTQERIAIENILSELEPDLIISLSGINDVHWSYAKRNIFWFQTLSEQFFSYVLNLGLKSVHYEELPTSVPKEYVPPQVVSSRIEKNVRLSLATLAPHNVQYFYFLQPALPVTKKQLSLREKNRFQSKTSEWNSYFQECYLEIKNTLSKVQDSKFHFFDISPVFDGATESNEIFVDAYHFGDKGNDLIAQSIASQLEAVLTQLSK